MAFIAFRFVIFCFICSACASFCFAQHGEPSVIHENNTVVSPVQIERIDAATVRFFNGYDFILDVAGWQLVTGTNHYTFPVRSQVPPLTGISIPFISYPGDTVFIITTGGNQFENTPIQIFDSADQMPVPIIAMSRTQTEVPASGTDAEAAQIGVLSQVSKPAGTLFVWFSLLIGSIALAIAPFLIMRSEQHRKKDQNKEEL